MKKLVCIRVLYLSVACRKVAAMLSGMLDSWGDQIDDETFRLIYDAYVSMGRAAVTAKHHGEPFQMRPRYRNIHDQEDSQ